MSLQQTTVGKNAFYLNLNVRVVVRFPGIGMGPEQNELLVSTAVQPVSHDMPTGTSELTYANRETGNLVGRLPHWLLEKFQKIRSPGEGCVIFASATRVALQEISPTTIVRLRF